MSTFGPDPRLLRQLWWMLAVEDGFLRVSWSPGAGLAPLEFPEPAGEEGLVQRMVAEFDAQELTGGEVGRVLEGVDDAERPGLVSYDFAPVDVEGWSGMVARMCEDRDVRLSVGVRRRRGHGTADRARVLWARVESKKGVAALERFRPAPTLVLREGSTARMVALWALRQPLTYDWLVRANKRIAHRLWGAKKWAEPEFVFPAPGSCLRTGRQRPVPVHVVARSAVLYSPRQVVGHLRESPNPNAWREAA